MIDASRVGGRGNGPGVPHSHIVEEHGGGWRNTVNIRVFTVDAWTRSRRPRVWRRCANFKGIRRSVGQGSSARTPRQTSSSSLPRGRKGSCQEQPRRTRLDCPWRRAGLRRRNPFVANHCPWRGLIDEACCACVSGDAAGAAACSPDPLRWTRGHQRRLVLHLTLPKRSAPGGARESADADAAVTATARTGETLSPSQERQGLG